jgi:hypothetical protein
MYLERDWEHPLPIDTKMANEALERMKRRYESRAEGE